MKKTIIDLQTHDERVMTRFSLEALKSRLKSRLPTAIRHRLKRIYRPVRFGNLRRVTPIGRSFGYDRGLLPIDRYYIEGFLARHAADIQGRVLELEDNSYTLRFGGNHVTQSDVLDLLESNPRATFVGDLTKADHLPSGVFDCIILTQALQIIYDVRAALKTLYRILKPEGVLLVTVPGISQVVHGPHDTWGSTWSFTGRAVQQLFEEIFPASEVEVEVHGNVLVALAFLHGLALEELRSEELEYNDPDYQVLITVKAVKPRTTL